MSNFLNFAGNQGLTFKDHGTGGGTSFTLDANASTNSVLLSVGGILQSPGVDYTVSGATVTTTSSITSGVEVLSYIVHKPGTAPTIQDNSVSNAKMLDDAVGLAELSATGTPSSSNFLRGDNAWAAAGGGMWSHVATTVFDDTATYERTGLVADEWYKINMMGVVHSTAGGPGMVLGHGGTPTYITSDYRWSQKAQQGSTDEDTGGTSGTRFDVYSAAGDQSASYGVNVEIILYTGSADSVRIPMVWSTGVQWENSIGVPTAFVFCGGNVNSAFNSAHASAFKMDPISSGNFTYGEMQFFVLSN